MRQVCPCGVASSSAAGAASSAAAPRAPFRTRYTAGGPPRMIPPSPLQPHTSVSSQRSVPLHLPAPPGSASRRQRLPAAAPCGPPETSRSRASPPGQGPAPKSPAAPLPPHQAAVGRQRGPQPEQHCLQPGGGDLQRPTGRRGLVGACQRFCRSSCAARPRALPCQSLSACCSPANQSSFEKCAGQPRAVPLTSPAPSALQPPPPLYCLVTSAAHPSAPIRRHLLGRVFRL